MIDLDELRARSGLPGPRANLELAHEVAESATPDEVARLVGTDEEYLVLCGAIGLGRLVAEGDRSRIAELRRLANDERWRVREGVAMGLQRWGDADFEALADEALRWAGGTPLEQRAAAAGLCEPRLLTTSARVARTLELLELATQAPRDRTLRKALGYCWSVAVAADPEQGLPAFERLRLRDDADVAWIVRENEKKKRLARLLTQ